MRPVRCWIMKLILASASPRRKELLASVIPEFEVIAADCAETADFTAPPEDIVENLARQKAQSVAYGHSDAYVLGADTIVYFNGKVLGKPIDAKDAARTLRALSGRTHAVYTGYCILGGGKTVCGNCRTEVVFRDLSDAFIKEYVATGKPLDKAGGYGIQDDERLVKEYFGSYTNVVGLPCEEITAQFKKIGLLQ